MLSINVFELAYLVNKFRKKDFSNLSKNEAVKWMHEQMLHIPEEEREKISNEFWYEHLRKLKTQ